MPPLMIWTVAPFAGGATPIMPITRTGMLPSHRSIRLRNHSPLRGYFPCGAKRASVRAGEAVMPALTIRHVTTYRYRQPVAFGEHRMMLRPRDSHDQRVIDATLGITPQPSSLRFDRDAFGNHVAIAEFAATATELSFESVVSVEHSPSDLALDEAALAFPVDYGGDGASDL